MSELVSELTHGAAILSKSSYNSVSLTAGADLLLRFVTLQRPSVHQPFSTHKLALYARAKEFVQDSHACVEKIVEYATGLIKDDAVSDTAIKSASACLTEYHTGNHDALLFKSGYANLSASCETT